MRDQILGCILGGAIGDALGGAHEGKRTPTEISDEAYAGALAVVIAVRVAARGLWDGSDNLLRIVSEALPDTQVRDRLIALAEIEEGITLREIARRFGCSGFVIESVPLALCGASRIWSLGFRTVLTQLIACGGDTDTIASMAGQVAGALIGRKQLPIEMVVRTPDRDSIEAIAGEFAESLGFHE